MRDLQNLQFTNYAISIILSNIMLISNAERTKPSDANPNPLLLPLWTIGTPDLLEAIQNKRVNSQKSKKFLPLDYIPAQTRFFPKDFLDAAYLRNYLNKIRESIAPYTCFGSMCTLGYDYELLVMNSNSYFLSLSSEHPTGGSYAGPLGEIYFHPCINFSDLEIIFFQQILKGNNDSIILKNLQTEDKSEEVLKSFRLFVCNQLATEVILSKLILYINNQGLAKILNIHDIEELCFSIDELNILLTKCSNLNHLKNQAFLNENSRSDLLMNYESFLNSNSYEEDYVFVKPAEEIPKEEPAVLASITKESPLQKLLQFFLLAPPAKDSGSTSRASLASEFKYK